MSEEHVKTLNQARQALEALNKAAVDSNIEDYRYHYSGLNLLLQKAEKEAAGLEAQQRTVTQIREVPAAPDHTDPRTFIEAFNARAASIHQTARDKGFWDQERNEAEIIMLVVTELAEAVEALRHGNPPDDKVPDFDGVEAELADAVIRIMDYAGGKRLRVAEALVAKTAFNASRPRLHGKAF